MLDGLSTELLIAAQSRLAAQSGVSVIAIHRGASGSGAILLKINRLDGTAELLGQIRIDEERVWSPIGIGKPLPETQADQVIAREIEEDPDLWVVEVEDRQGRPWFPGRVVRIDAL